MQAQAARELRRESLADQIVEKVRDDILTGKYAPGRPLPGERDLAAVYGVNRHSVRQALVKLEQARLISIRQGIGSVVNDYKESGGLDLIEHLLLRGGRVDPKIAREVFEARRLLAAMIAARAAHCRIEKDLRTLEKILGDLKEVREKGGPVDRVQRLESAFFQALARASRNRVFVFLTNSLVAVYRRYMPLFSHAFQETEWLSEHLEGILDAVGRSDEHQAETRTSEYFCENEKRLLGMKAG